MKKIYAVIMAVCFLGMAVAALAADPAAGPRGQGHAWGPAQQHERFAKYLDLSKEQQEKMKEVRNRYFADTREMRYDFLQKKLEMRKLFGDPKVDEATLAAKQKEVIALKVKLAERKGQMKLEMRRILTAEQIQKLDRLPRHRGMGRGGCGGMGQGMMGHGMKG